MKNFAKFATIIFILLLGISSNAESDTQIEGEFAYIYGNDCVVNYSVQSNGNNSDGADTAIVQIKGENNECAAIRTKGIVYDESGRSLQTMYFNLSELKCDLGDNPSVNIMLWNPLEKASPISEMKTSDIVNAYKVIYDYNYSNNIKVTTYVEKNGVSEFQQPSREGYTFENWMDERGNIWEDGNKVTSDITLYAKWRINEYTVSFNINDSETVDKVVEFNSKIDAIDITKAGHTLEGWYTDSGKKWDFDTDVVKMDTKLTPKWSVNSYRVTFNKQNQTENDFQTITYNELAVKPEDPELKEHNFSGWYTTSDCRADTQWDFSTDRVTEDVTLYAKWIKNKYTVTFETDGGTSVESQIIDYGGTVLNVTSTGYSLLGWYTEDGQKWIFDGTDGAMSVEGNLTLKAKWKLNLLTVSFNGNGGSTPGSVIVTYDEQYGSLPSSSRTGYNFVGWYTAASGGTKVTNTTTVTIAGNHTLYAHWDRIYITVPNFSGWYIDSVRNWLSSNGLNYTESWRNNWERAWGLCNENSYAGATVEYGTTINVNYSNGAKALSVGDWVEFSGGNTYGSVGGTARWREASWVYICDGPYNGVWWGINYNGGGYARICWIHQDLLSQRTN